MAKQASCLVAIWFALCISQLGAILRSTKLPRNEVPNARWMELPRKEVLERGSYCLDGSSPGLYFRDATNESAKTKWVLTLQAGGWCGTVDECAKRVHSDLQKHVDFVNDLSVAELDVFKDFNHVTFWYCDGGIFSGDSMDTPTVRNPVTGKNITLFFRGKRILDHLVQRLYEKHEFYYATEVLLTGGSAGGLATYMVADYLGGMLPKSVTKYRALPQSSWWSSDGSPTNYSGNIDDMKAFYELHKMGGTGSRNCKARTPDKAWKCIFSDVSYMNSLTPMFVVQVLDLFVAVQNQESEDTASDDQICAMNSLSNKYCNADSISRLDKTIHRMVDKVHKSWKYSSKGEGGFISTCNLHSFYKYDEFFHFAIDGVKLQDAVANWWEDENTKHWHLPCHLHSAPNIQCEPSCAYSSPRSKFNGKV